MTRTVTVAALQTSYGEDMQANIDKTIGLIRQAAAKGAQVILPSELFQGPYFCVTQEEHWFATAYPWREHPAVVQLQPVARELGVVIIASLFERRAAGIYHNTAAVLDGEIDLDHLRAVLAEHADDVAAIMITYPSTHGVYEAHVRQVCDLVHAAGGPV